MKLITAVVDPELLDTIRDALRDAGITGLTISQAHGAGRRGGEVKTYRGADYVDDLRAGARLEMVVAGREDAEQIVNLLVAITHAHPSALGKVWVGDVDWVVSLRTGEMNFDAI